MKTIAQLIKWDFEANDSLVIQNKNGKLIYFENSAEFWTKYEYDSEGNEIYYINSDGFWAKYEYDSERNKIYYEDSEGKIIDNRPKPCEDRVIEIDGVKYKLVKV